MSENNYKITDYILHGIYFNTYFLVKYLPPPIGNFLRYLFSFPFFKKSKYCRIGEGTTIWYPYRISIEKDVTINEFCYLSGYGEIFISQGTRIGKGCTFITSDHVFDNLDIPIYQQGVIKGKITVGENVWIGSNTTILKGITIGKNAIIAAGAVVNKNVPENAIVGGIPAKVLKYRAEET